LGDHGEPGRERSAGVPESVSDKRPLRTAEAAAILKLSQTKLRSLEEGGTLVPFRLPDSKHRRYRWEQVAALAESLYGVEPVHPDDRLPGS
jgi:hypothetical protein